MKKFQEYLNLREAEEKDEGGSSPLNSKITLGDGNDYEPFMVSDDPNSEHYGKNKGLAPIIRAFKKGANWGWSKDKESGEDKPVKVGSKKLYLTGGAVRDHLAGKTPRNIELATDASPDEVYHILKQNEFDFSDSKEGGKKGGNTFSVKTKDGNGRPFAFDISVDNDKFELEVFTKTAKGDPEPEPGTHADDASGRDFTMNAMSILLSNDNGDNKELHDFYGGMHHLAGGKVQCIGDMEDSFTKDPKRMLRFGRMVSGYGKPENVTDDEKGIVQKLAGLLQNLDPAEIMDDFKKGMSKDDCDSRKHLQIFGDLGLLGSIFPNKAIDENFPTELSELGDKNMSIAWMLRHNHPVELRDLGMGSDDAKVEFLVKALSLGSDLNESFLDDLTTNFTRSGISSRKLKEWATVMGKIEDSVVDAFVKHATSPRVKIYVLKDDGEEGVSEDFKDLFDPFTGQPVDASLVEGRKRQLEYKNFQKVLSFCKPV